MWRMLAGRGVVQQAYRTKNHGTKPPISITVDMATGENRNPIENGLMSFH